MLNLSRLMCSRTSMLLFGLWDVRQRIDGSRNRGGEGRGFMNATRHRPSGQLGHEESNHNHAVVSRHVELRWNGRV